jgi:hypothetical protein
MFAKNVNKGANLKSSLLVIKKTTTYITIAALGFSIIAGMRVFGWDRDYANYKRFYEKISFGGYTSRFEPGFEFFANSFKVLFGSTSFDYFLFTIAVISLSLKFLVLSNVKNYLILIFIYILLIYPLHEMTQIRVGLATGVMYWAFYGSTHANVSTLNKMLFIIIGISFHYSVVILVPFILLSKLLTKEKIIIFILFGISGCFLLNYSMPILEKYVPVIRYYLELMVLQNKIADGNPFSTRNLILFTILSIGFFNLRSIPKEKIPWFYLSITGFLLWFGFYQLPVFSHRFLEITIFSYLMWIPSLKKLYKIVCIILLFILSFYFVYRNFFTNPMFNCPC